MAKREHPLISTECTSLLQNNGLPETSDNLLRRGISIEADVVEEMVASLQDTTYLSPEEHPSAPYLQQA